MICIKAFYYVPLIFLAINFQVSSLEQCQISLSSHRDSYVDIDILHLPLHIKIILLSGKIYSIEDLVTKTEEELLSFPIPRVNSQKLTDLEETAIQRMTPKERKTFFLCFRDNLELFSPIRIALAKGGIHSLEDLVTKTEEELLNVKGIKENRLFMIQSRLTGWGLRLGMDMDSPSDRELMEAVIKGMIPKEKKIKTMGEKGLSEIKARLTKWGLRLGMDMSSSSDRKRVRKMANNITPSEKEVFLSSSRGSLRLSSRTRDILVSGSIHSIGSLVTKTERELVVFPGLKEYDIIEIRSRLAERGLRLGMDMSSSSDRKKVGKVVKNMVPEVDFPDWPGDMNQLLKKKFPFMEISPFTNRPEISILTPLEEKILKMRYGLGGENRHSLEEFEESFNIRSWKIKNIEAAALWKLINSQRVSRWL